MSKEQKRQAFYTQSPEEVLKAVDATEQGLSSSEAEKRLAEFGHNELEEGEKRSILVKFIDYHPSCGSNLVSRDFWWGRYRRCHYHLSRGYH